jgi:hypothetical protein
MQMQLTLDFAPRPQVQHKPIIKNTTCADVSDVARGVGFKIPVEVSIALSDALVPLQTEDEEAYDQHLYDASGVHTIIARWIASKNLSHSPSTFCARTNIPGRSRESVCG